MLDKVNRHNVTLLSGLFRERADLNRNYLFELDSTCLLQNFYLEAGVVMPGLQVVDDKAPLGLGSSYLPVERSFSRSLAVCGGSLLRFK